MAAFHIAMTAFYSMTVTFYTAMAASHSVEHSRKLCSIKVSSPVSLLTRADPPTFPRCSHLTMISRKDQPASNKDKLATTMKDQPASQKDKLANQAMLHTRAMLVPVLHTVPNQAMMHTCAMLDPVQNIVPNPAQLHTRAMRDPVLDTVPNPATLHTLGKVLIMEDDLHSFNCLPLMKHCEALSLLHQGGDQGREEEGRARGGGDPRTGGTTGRRRTSGPASSQLGQIYPAKL